MQHRSIGRRSPGPAVLGAIQALVLAGALGCVTAGPATAQHYPLATVGQARHGFVGTRVVNHQVHVRVTEIGWERIQRPHHRARLYGLFKLRRLCGAHHHRPCGRAHYFEPYESRSPGARIAGRHWWNPVTWDWKGFIGSAYHSVFKPCALGGAAWTMMVGSRYLGAKYLLARGFLRARQAATLNPTAVAVEALGGCLFSVTTHTMGLS